MFEGFNKEDSDWDNTINKLKFTIQDQSEDNGGNILR